MAVSERLEIFILVSINVKFLIGHLIVSFDSWGIQMQKIPSAISLIVGGGQDGLCECVLVETVTQLLSIGLQFPILSVL